MERGGLLQPGPVLLAPSEQHGVYIGAPVPRRLRRPQHRGARRYDIVHQYVGPLRYPPCGRPGAAPRSGRSAASCHSRGWSGPTPARRASRGSGRTFPSVTSRPSRRCTEAGWLRHLFVRRRGCSARTSRNGPKLPLNRDGNGARSGSGAVTLQAGPVLRMVLQVLGKGRVLAGGCGLVYDLSITDFWTRSPA